MLQSIFKNRIRNKMEEKLTEIEEKTKKTVCFGGSHFLTVS